MTPSTATIDNSFKFSDIQGNSAVYTMENTPDKESDFSNIVDNDLTKVVVRAQLVNASGTSVPRYVFLGAQMADENAVKNAILNNFTQYWIHTSTGYRQLQNSDLRFVSGTNISGGDSYRAYAQLVTPFADANTGNESTLYTKNATGGYDPVVDGVNTVNTNLQSFTAQIWTDGACYYTTTVPHLAKDTGLGQYGVVRNHSYVVNVTDVKGFGTPVYDPNNDDIDKPVTPEEDYSYLAATINILSWKVVSSGVTLGK